jgi:hypothetical protein
MVLNNLDCSLFACLYQHLTGSEMPIVAFGNTNAGLPVESSPRMHHFLPSALFVNLPKQNFTCGASHFFVPSILQLGVLFVLEWGIVPSRAGREQTIWQLWEGGGGRVAQEPFSQRGILGMEQKYYFSNRTILSSQRITSPQVKMSSSRFQESQDAHHL